MILSSKFIIPIGTDFIQNGAILIEGDKIKAIGPRELLLKNNNGPVIDLGNSILLPGLDFRSSKPKEPPLQLLTEPYVKLSLHTALPVRRQNQAG